MIFSVAKLATLVLSLGSLCFSSIARALLAASSDISTSTGTSTGTSTSTSISDVVNVSSQWPAMAADIIESSSPTGMVASLSVDVLRAQTSQTLRDSYDKMVVQTINQIRDKLTNSQNFADAYGYEFLQKTWDSATAYLSPQQLQIIDDAVSMLCDSYAYDAVQREITLHKDCIAAAYQHLSSAAKIALDRDYGGGDQQARRQQLKQHILSAVQQLQDSCPLCRALKFAASEANQSLLPFVTVLSTSILKSLHPFLDSSPLNRVPLPIA